MGPIGAMGPMRAGCGILTKNDPNQGAWRRGKVGFGFIWLDLVGCEELHIANCASPEYPGISRTKRGRNWVGLQVDDVETGFPSPQAIDAPKASRLASALLFKARPFSHTNEHLSTETRSGCTFCYMEPG
jgi:hypothetical protein